MDGVNDKNEAQSLDFPLANTAIFTSSWTSHSDESIPMWRMYARDMDGVRIKLPVNMFKGRDTPTVFDKGGSQIRYADSINIQRKESKLVFHTNRIFGPNKVYYTNEDKYLLSKTLHQSYDDYITINLHDLGMFKEKCWEFEQEWRFKILAFPNESSLPDDEITKENLDLNTYPIIEKSINVNLETGIFNEAEFMLGPKASEAQHILLTSLIEKYAPEARVFYSNLNIR
ncbi:DUF2971 domain-containing protein [Bacillus sp. sid0103]|uniref:DUF2971 domain-containing protein n=1 Tax=Bacillus sp. sid0103 TaxID=2856337 RepID=UPI001C4771B8|nr:DUF2971 domain-containing protein [Bacillus sp. sid0103]MBV7509736.1 DUF2971 domain-containing protein [Bacillus sp. sid0103]